MEETHALATAMFMLWYAFTDLPSLVDYRALRCLWNCGLKDLTYCHAGAEEHHLWGHLQELVRYLSQRDLKLIKNYSSLRNMVIEAQICTDIMCCDFLIHQNIWQEFNL